MNENHDDHGRFAAASGAANQATKAAAKRDSSVNNHMLAGSLKHDGGKLFERRAAELKHAAAKAHGVAAVAHEHAATLAVKAESHVAAAGHSSAQTFHQGMKEKYKHEAMTHYNRSRAADYK